jgi:hypothetical protein
MIAALGDRPRTSTPKESPAMLAPRTLIVTLFGFLLATLVSVTAPPTRGGVSGARPQVTLGVVARAQSMVCFSRCREAESACQSTCWEGVGSCQREGGTAEACATGRDACVVRCREGQAACNRSCL